LELGDYRLFVFCLLLIGRLYKIILHNINT
jgi:hypothetical protein